MMDIIGRFGALFMAIIVYAVQSGQAPQLYFRRIENKEALEWASGNGADEQGLGLYTEGRKIHPLDKDTAFFFGTFVTSMASIRSFLLRSSDGGKTWRDVMSPVYGSSVEEVFFLDRHSGWALILWTTEGYGDVTLYRSKDGGMSWRKVSAVPKRHWTGMPLNLKFVDEKNGSIEMLYYAGSDDSGLATLRTRDGGRTWVETSRIPIDEYEKRNQKTDPSDQDILEGQDGSQWQLQEAGEQIRVLRRIQVNEIWSEVCAIPMSYGYSNGRVLLDRKKR